MTFKVFRADGTEVMPGDKLIDFRGDEATFTGCTHPRKIKTNLMGCEKYPSVFNVEIREASDGYVWNAVSEHGRAMLAAQGLDIVREIS
jgi:hypothetical protein